MLLKFLIATITFKGIPVAFRFVLVSGYLARFTEKLVVVFCVSVSKVFIFDLTQNIGIKP